MHAAWRSAGSKAQAGPIVNTQDGVADLFRALVMQKSGLPPELLEITFIVGFISNILCFLSRRLLLSCLELVTRGTSPKISF